MNVLNYFRDKVHEMGGSNYQTVINVKLRDHLQRDYLETVIRRAVREELRALASNKAAGSGR